MSSTKGALRAAKAAIDASEWDEAVKQADIVVASDHDNYFARLFLGRAYEKKGDVEKAAKAYNEAAKLKPDDNQAWLGLASLYEAQGSKYMDEYGEVAVHLAVQFGKSGDLHRGQTTIDKLVMLAKRNGTSAQFKRALQVMLPGSPIWEHLEARIPHPSHTLKRIIEVTEKDEQAWITKEIAERRTRIGARLGKVTEEVKNEVYASSDLEGLYRAAIDWNDDDTTRRQYEEKLFQRAYDTLIVMPKELKQAKRAQVVESARGMVIVKHPYQLAWDVYLEWQDISHVQDLDVNVLLEYVTFFTASGLTKVLRAFLRSEISPFHIPRKSDSEDDNDQLPELTSEDRLLLMAEGLGDGRASPLAHRLTTEYYLSLDEYESAIDTARNGLKALKVEESKAALVLQADRDAFNTILATSLVHYQSPKNHPEARELLEDILKRDPSSAQALIGLGLVYEEEEKYMEAVNLFTQALEQDSSNATVKIESAWCQALDGNYQEALDEFEEAIESITTDDPKSRDLKALTQYRIGWCVWQIDNSKPARRDRNGAYKHFLQAIKTNPSFAPAYTSLGHYYADYAKDKKRARQCFQKAFELSSSEVEAAERLASAFADQGEWEVVELVAQRVIDSGKTRISPGSKKRGISWPYSALGVVQMTRQEYTKAITSFLSALRISPEDYHSYVGLGESYHNSGRYNSASRTFHYAEAPHDGINMKISGERWFTDYMLANVHRELGDHDEAIERLKIVLQGRPKEFGVLIALLQTYIERAWRLINTGFYGKAAASAKDALDLAKSVIEMRPTAFNVWKAVGDACSVFHWCQESASVFSATSVQSLLTSQLDGASAVFRLHEKHDSITLESCEQTNGNAVLPQIPSYLMSAVLAYKRGIHCSSTDVHAQAVAWYNLGWAEHRIAEVLDKKAGRRFAHAAVRCFKRAIELEGGNAEYWNALGVVVSDLNSQIAQHAFVRSLYLNERNAQVWANLAALYLDQGDHELAHQAFGRAQSTDPEYAHAWLGEGIIAKSVGNESEALSHFVHAFEISSSASMIIKKQYALSVFDSLVSDKATTSSDLTQLIQPLFALQQLHSQSPTELIFRHISALLSERTGDFTTASSVLTDICATLEALYEETESPQTLEQFATAKADLARNHLALRSFALATEHATTALDLTDDDTSPATLKTRLSAHLTLGLAAYYSSGLDASLASFRSALGESSSASKHDNDTATGGASGGSSAVSEDPAVICLLSRVLYAHGGENERSVARDQLLAVVEAEPGHVEAWALLGAMAGSEGDVEGIEAVRGDLAALQGQACVGGGGGGGGEAQRERVGRLLVALAGVVGRDTEGQEQQQQSMLAEVQREVVLRPDGAQGWAALAVLADDEAGSEYAAAMALLAARRNVPPHGTLGAEGLAEAYAGTARITDAQRAVMLAPWSGVGWEALHEAVSGAT